MAKYCSNECIFLIQKGGKLTSTMCQRHNRTLIERYDNVYLCCQECIEEHDRKEDKMQQAEVKKLDNGNRVLIPTKYLEELGVERNGVVLVVKDSNEDCIKIFKVEE